VSLVIQNRIAAKQAQAQRKDHYYSHMPFHFLFSSFGLKECGTAQPLPVQQFGETLIG
jgi:hypothetical protein